jgi:hypothetical protein
MKKIVAGVMAATVFALAGPAAAYEATVETNTKTNAPKKQRAGEKGKVKFSLGTASNGQPCTGRVEMTVLKLKPNGDPKKTVFIKTKDVEDLKGDGRGRFSLKLFKRGKYRVIVKYRRGSEDPCSFSRDASDIRIRK